MLNLQKQLDDFGAQVFKKIPAETKSIMNNCNDSLNLELANRDIIKAGEQLPNFLLKNQNGELVESVKLTENAPLVISFFRGVWCPFCNIEIKALESYAKEFRKVGAEIVVISPQTVNFTKKSVEENNTSFDILSDMENKYAQRLGISFTLPDDLKNVYKNFGINLPQFNGDESWTLPMPARIVVAKGGEVLSVNVNADYTKRPEPSETLNTLKSLLK